MITLCMDTSYKKLVLVLIENNCCIGSIEEDCERQQSELLFPTLQRLLQQTNVDKTAIQKIVVTTGPGSYTGVRIALTLAKVMASLLNIPLYTISTLQLYKIDAAIIDAKGGKVFVGETNDYLTTVEEAKLKLQGKKVAGDTHLIGEATAPVNISEQFIAKQNLFTLVEDVDALIPTYLKEAI